MLDFEAALLIVKFAPIYRVPTRSITCREGLSTPDELITSVEIANSSTCTSTRQTHNFPILANTVTMHGQLTG